MLSYSIYCNSFSNYASYNNQGRRKHLKIGEHMESGATSQAKKVLSKLKKYLEVNNGEEVLTGHSWGQLDASYHV